MFAFAVYGVSAISAAGFGAFSFARKSSEQGAVCAMIAVSFIARMVVTFSHTNASSMIAAAVDVISIVPFAMYFFVNVRLFERARLAMASQLPFKFSSGFNIVYLLFIAAALGVIIATGWEDQQADSTNIILRAAAAVSVVASLGFFINAVGLKSKVDATRARASVVVALSALASSIAWLVWASSGAAIAASLFFDVVWAVCLVHLHRSTPKQSPAVPSKSPAIPDAQVPVDTA